MIGYQKVKHLSHGRVERREVEKQPAESNIALSHHREDSRHRVEQAVRCDSSLCEQAGQLGHKSSSAISCLSCNSFHLQRESAPAFQKSPQWILLCWPAPPWLPCIDPTLQATTSGWCGRRKVAQIFEGKVRGSQLAPSHIDGDHPVVTEILVHNLSHQCLLRFQHLWLEGIMFICKSFLEILQRTRTNPDIL